MHTHYPVPSNVKWARKQRKDLEWKWTYIRMRQPWRRWTESIDHDWLTWCIQDQVYGVSHLINEMLATRLLIISIYVESASWSRTWSRSESSTVNRVFRVTSASAENPCGTGSCWTGGQGLSRGAEIWSEIMMRTKRTEYIQTLCIKKTYQNFLIAEQKIAWDIEECMGQPEYHADSTYRRLAGRFFQLVNGRCL